MWVVWAVPGVLGLIARFYCYVMTTLSVLDGISTPTMYVTYIGHWYILVLPVL